MHLVLKGTPWETQADAFRRRVFDVTAYLERLGELRPFLESGLGKETVIAYHDACHLANAQGVRRQPRDLLRRIPGVTLVEIAEAHLCCGSAGTYNIDQPEIAASLGRRKAEAILRTGAQVVASGNIGCLTQLKLHLAKQGKALPIRHTVQILRDAWRGG
jgi:glycolate oxidase iron-sulfur subunit